MSGLTLHDDIDRLDTGITQNPDVSGIISAARRRRRRTRAILTAGGLATAAVVAPLALLVGGGATTAPSSPGFAAGQAAVSNEEPTDAEYEAQYAADITAAMTEAVPAATLKTAIDWWGFGSDWGQGYELPNGAYVVVNSSFDRHLIGHERRACHPGPDEKGTSCTETVVGDQVVRVVEGDYSNKGRDLFRYVDVFPVGDAGGPSISVDAGVMGADASFDQLPSLETLTDLALDQRLVPTREPDASDRGPGVLVSGRR